MTGVAIVILTMLTVGSMAVEEASAAKELPRKLETAERIMALKGGGYFPVLTKLADGTLAAVVRGGFGARHMGPNGLLELITSSDGGKSWSAPRLIVFMPPDTNSPAFGQAADGRLVCAFTVSGVYPKGQWVYGLTDAYTVWVTTSDDNGNTWTPPRQINTDPYPYASPYGKIVLLSDGTLLMNLYSWYLPESEGAELPQDKRGWFGGVSRSTDNGMTWSAPIPIVGHNSGRTPNTNYSEIGLMVLPGDKALAVMRGGPLDGVDQCISSDGGLTWGPIENIIPGLNRQPADAILLKSGRLLLTFGKRGVTPMGVEAVLSHNKPGQWDQLAGPTPATRPAAPVPESGKQWDWQTHVALEWNAANEDCGYPSSVQLDDGTIVTLYYQIGEMDRPDDISLCGHGLMEYAKCVRYQEADLLAGAKPMESK